MDVKDLGDFIEFENAKRKVMINKKHIITVSENHVNSRATDILVINYEEPFFVNTPWYLIKEMLCSDDLL